MRIRLLSAAVAAGLAGLGAVATPAAASILQGVTTQGRHVYLRTSGGGNLTRITLSWVVTCTATGTSFSERLMVQFRHPVRHGFEIHSPVSGHQGGFGYRVKTVVTGHRQGPDTWTGRVRTTVRLTRDGRYYDRCALRHVTWKAPSTAATALA